MKKYFNYMLVAALVGSLSLSVTSCKDDDDKNGGDKYVETAINLSIDNDVKTHGIETDVNSAIVELPVSCTGRWGAWIVGKDEDTNWLEIEDNKVDYQGNQTLRLIFDENRTGYDRTATLRIVTDNGDKIDIAVRQTAMWNGQPVENGNGQWFGDYGLGRGLNYEYFFEGDSVSNSNKTFSPSSMTRQDPIFCWAKIDELQKKLGANGEPILSHDAYVEAQAEEVNFDDTMSDSLIHSKDTISVTFDLRIGFGFFQMEGRGKYESSEIKGHAKANYQIARHLTVYDAFISPSEIVETAQRIGGESTMSKEELDAQEAEIINLQENYEKQNYKKYNSSLWKKKATDEQKEMGYLEDWQMEKLQEMYESLGLPDYGGLFSKSFARLYFNLNRAVEQNKTDRIEQLLKQLDAKYGPVFVSRGWFGGSLNMNVVADTAYLINKGTFKGGMSANIMDGLVSFDGDVKYGEEATRLVRNSKSVYGIYGGDATGLVAAMTSHFAGDSMSDRNALLEVLNKWSDSLKETTTVDGKSKPSRAAMEQMQLTGIWTLFDTPKVFDVVSTYMYKKHPTLKNYVGSIQGEKYFAAKKDTTKKGTK
jgi:hypothetical protein